jgi:hypothetical protein
MKPKSKKSFVIYRLRKFLNKWNEPTNELDLSEDLNECELYEEGWEIVDKIIHDKFRIDFWEWYGEEIGEYELWKDYINDFFTNEMKEHQFPIGYGDMTHYKDYQTILDDYLESWEIHEEGF